MKTKNKTQSLSFKFTPDVRKLLGELSAQLGISMVAIMELAIREFAQRHKPK